MQDDPAGAASRRTALTGSEAGRRQAVLARLQDALAARGVRSVLAGRHILTLRGDELAQRSRPGDPELRVLVAGRWQVVTTDGRSYHFAGCRANPADDPDGAAGRVLTADMRLDAGRRADAPADRRAGGGDRVIGAGERALRRLCEDGVI